MISRYFTQKVAKKYPYREDDPQVHLIYEMERLFIGPCIRAHVSHKSLQEIANHACRQWGVPLVPVIVRDSKRKAFGWCDHEIILNSAWHGDNLGVLLHELAHWIASEIFGDDNIAAHGPEWVNIYLDLLDQYKVFPRKYAEMMFKDWGITWQSPAQSD